MLTQKIVMARVGKAKGTVIAIVIVLLDWYATMIGGGKTTTVKQDQIPQTLDGLFGENGVIAWENVAA
jgi:hypothetical protein